jgi:hypothetical protein
VGVGPPQLRGQQRDHVRVVVGLFEGHAHLQWHRVRNSDGEAAEEVLVEFGDREWRLLLGGFGLMEW